MEMSDQLPDAAVLRELGARAARIRLERNLTQARLAQEAGVHRNTVDRFEGGNSISLLNLVRIMRALELIPELANVFPQREPSPVELLRLRGGERRRARAPQGEGGADGEGAWRWGDEEAGDAP